MPGSLRPGHSTERGDGPHYFSVIGLEKAKTGQGLNIILSVHKCNTWLDVCLLVCWVVNKMNRNVAKTSLLSELLFYVNKLPSSYMTSLLWQWHLPWLLSHLSPFDPPATLFFIIFMYFSLSLLTTSLPYTSILLPFPALDISPPSLSLSPVPTNKPSLVFWLVVLGRRRHNEVTALKTDGCNLVCGPAICCSQLVANCRASLYYTTASTWHLIRELNTTGLWRERGGTYT